MTALRISELAAQAGVPSTTLRYYEQVGLLAADRTPGGYRVYGEQAVERLRFIGAAKRLHLSLDSIRELLTAWQDESCRTVKARLRPMVSARLADAESGIADLVDLAGDLRAGLSRLDDLPDRDELCDPSCAFLGPDQAPTHDPAPARLAEAAGGDDGGGGGGDDDDPVFACSLAGVDHVDRLARWHRLLAVAPPTDVELGITASLPADRVGEVVDLIAAEQRCCPFLHFRLDFAGPGLDLTVTAPDEAAASFVRALVPAAAR